MSSISSRFFLLFFFDFLGCTSVSFFRFAAVWMIESAGRIRLSSSCAVEAVANAQFMVTVTTKTVLTIHSRSQVQVLVE